jgi:hypothetical protein
MAAVAIAGAGGGGGGSVGSDARVGVGITLKKDQDGLYAVREVAVGGSAENSGEVCKYTLKIEALFRIQGSGFRV